MSLHSLTSFASFDIFSDIMLNSRPPIIPCNQFGGFIASGVSCNCRIMMFFDDVFSKFGVLGDVKLFSEGDKSIIEDLPTFFVVF